MMAMNQLIKNQTKAKEVREVKKVKEVKEVKKRLMYYQIKILMRLAHQNLNPIGKDPKSKI